MGKIRVGFIGCGGNASGHLGRMLGIPEAQVVALCDVDQASLQRAKERNPQAAELPEFTHYQEMLEQVELDAVEISTPHTLHFEQIMAALDKGLHVLTEKPMVCTVDHARQVIAKAEATGKVLMISYQRHLGGAVPLCAQSDRGRGIGGYPVYSGAPRPEVVSGDDWDCGGSKWRCRAADSSTTREATYWTSCCG